MIFTKYGNYMGAKKMCEEGRELNVFLFLYNFLKMQKHSCNFTYLDVKFW